MMQRASPGPPTLPSISGLLQDYSLTQLEPATKESTMPIGLYQPPRHLLPTPPQQIHDAFLEKPGGEADVEDNRAKSPIPQEKDIYTPPSATFRKRSHDDTFDNDERGDLSTPKEDFVLYEQSSPLAPRTTTTTTTFAGSSELNPAEAKYNAWAARCPVMTPVQLFNRDPLAWAKFVLAEQKQIKQDVKAENARREAEKQTRAKKAPRFLAIPAPKPRSIKRRRLADANGDSPVPPATRAATRSPKEANLTLREERTASREGTVDSQAVDRAALNLKARVVQMEPKQSGRPGKPLGTKPIGTVKVKPVNKSKVSKPAAQPKKTVKKTKEGTMTEHSSAIKEALKARMQSHANSKDKGAYHLYNDAYIPQVSIDGKELPKPGRDNMPPPKALNIHDQYYDQLHPLERQLAERIRLTPIEYLTQKSRYFLGTGEWFRLGHEKLNKAHAQVFCNQDGNNTSEMHQVYEAWGWNEPSNWPEDILQNLKPITSCKLPAKK